MFETKWTIGRTSLLLFGTFLSFLILTIVLTYLPRDSDYRTELTGFGLLFGFGLIFVGYPALLASFITSIVSLVKKRSWVEGLVTLICNALLTVGTMVWLLIK